MAERPDRAAASGRPAPCCAARSATLATAEDGQPYAALVTPAAAPDLSLLVLLSGLSAHTRHLRADGRCALMVQGAATDANPQTAPRLTVTGVAAPEPDPALKARWVARHPYAAFYADLADFRLVRIRPTGGQFVGGFASAHRLDAADLTPDPAAVAAVADAEASLLAHVTGRPRDASPHRRQRRLADGGGGRGRLRPGARGGGAAHRLAGTGGGCGGGAPRSWRGCQASRALPCTRKGTVVPFTPFEGGWRTTVARMVG